MNQNVVRLEQLEPLAQGSNACIHKAFDSNQQIHVVVKSAQRPSNDENDQGIPVSILREAALLRSLHHPHVISLHEVLMTPSTVCLVMDLYSCDLCQHLDELRAGGCVTTDPVSLRRIGSHLLSALGFCHDNDVMHRHQKSCASLI